VADHTQTRPSAPPVMTYDSPSWHTIKHDRAQSLCLPFTWSHHNIHVTASLLIHVGTY